MPPVNRRVLLKRRPEAHPSASDFMIESVPLPEPVEGQVVVETLFLSLDPYMGSAIKGRHMSGAVHEGDLMPGDTIGRVLKSRHADLREGDLVSSRTGWQSHALASGSESKASGMAAALAPVARKIQDVAGISPSLYLGVLGMPGLTAYAGTVDMLEPKPGQTLAVSAASGAVGATVGQIARNMGARAVGIAGSDEKCRFVVEQMGFAACVNRRKPGWEADLAAACPDGIDRYFDTVGGLTLEVAMANLAMHSRIVLCGMMDQYNSSTILKGPALGPVLGKRATISGVVVYDHFAKMPRWRAIGADWIKSGKLVAKEDIVPGLDAAPAAFARLMAGENFGKTVVAIAA